MDEEDERDLDLLPSQGPPSNTQLLSAYDHEAICLLTSTSLFACLARLGLVALFSGQNEVFATAWTQAAGCFAFGLFVHRRRETDRYWPALHIALRTGFAGGIATFAAWQIQSFTAFVNYAGVNQSWVANATNGISQIFITFAVAFFSLHFGRHINSHLPVIQDIRPLSSKVRLAVSSAAPFLYLAAVLSFCLTLHSATFVTGRRVALSLLFAPVGTWLRWVLAFKLNPVSPPYIRLGTWLCNVASTVLACTSWLLQRINPPSRSVSILQCQALQAIQDGFCGALSTIPAVLEQGERMHRTQRRFWMSWIYILGLQYGACLAITFIILGSGLWAHGLADSCQR